MKEYREHDEELNKNRALINALKKAGIEMYHQKGEWNGFGYKELPLVARIKSVGDQRKFNKIKKEVLAEQEAKPKKKKTEAEVIETWARRLVKLYNSTITDEDNEEKLTMEEAVEIAHAKLDYKVEKINEMIYRESERGVSRKRAQLIRKMERENPLRYIEDENHARSIVAAHERHNSGYDVDLESAHELEDEGKIEKGTAREVARKLYNGDMNYFDFT